MTYKDLCADIACLGFETEFDSPERVLNATNRALMIIYTERPLYGTVTINRPKIFPTAKIDDFSHKGGEANLFICNARAYSFKTSGIGKYKIYEGENEKIFKFSQNVEYHRGFLHGEGKIEFLGEYSYSVYDFCLFDEIYSQNIEDIPTASEYAEYRIKDYADGFLSFVSLPADEQGRAIKDSSARGGVVKIPSSYSGRINIIYKKCAQRLLGNPDEEIILPDGCEHLLALLAASYVWLDDDADKAQYYLTLYREAMSGVKYYDRTAIDNSYHITNGWA